MPAIQGIKIDQCENHTYIFDISAPAKIMRNGKNGFRRKMLKDEQNQCEIVFSYAVKLSEEQIRDLLPYCNVLDFEPYRDREMMIYEEGYMGYRDEEQLSFRAVTDSHIPLLELPMDYYYDEEHIWPSEKLYRYLIKTYFEGNKKLRRWGLVY